MGCRPRARSVRHCHCALALREGPLTGAVQDESQLQEDASKLAAGSTGGQANWTFVDSLKLGFIQFRKQRLALWIAGRGPDPSVTAIVFWPCERVVWRKASIFEGLKLVLFSWESNETFGSMGCRQGPDLSVSAMVLGPCGGVLWPELCRTKASCKRTQASWKLAVLLVQRCRHSPAFPAACASGIVSVLGFDSAPCLFWVHNCSAGWACVLVNAAGDIAASDTELSPTRKHMINLPSSNSAVHMLLAEWTFGTGASVCRSSFLGPAVAGTVLPGCHAASVVAASGRTQPVAQSGSWCLQLCISWVSAVVVFCPVLSRISWRTSSMMACCRRVFSRRRNGVNRCFARQAIWHTKANLMHVLQRCVPFWL